MNIDELHELARLYSLQLSYEDSTGKKRAATRETLEAILRTRIPQGASLRDALEGRRRELAGRVVEPAVVVWGRRAAAISLRTDQQTVEYELTLENGDRFAGRVPIGPANDSPARVLALPQRLPYGYHTLRLTLDGRVHETLIMAAPVKAPAPGASVDNGSPGNRSWGIFLPLYAARTHRTRGIGDLGDLEAYRNWINGCGGGIVATLPMLASFDDEPSPYSPVSRLYWNELFLDVERLPEYRPGDLDHSPLPNAAHAIDYRAASNLKRRTLQTMAERFEPDAEFEHFAVRASDYAEFRSHRERDRRTTSGDDRPVGTHRYHLYVQYRMAQQMRRVADDARRSGQGLYLDFPLGVNAGGYDVWRYRDQFARGVSVGAPPDLFFTKGQNWGFPPLDPDAVREHHHEYFRACIRHHVTHAGILRIDHVMGLHRLFWIPAGSDASEGVYVRYPEDELYAVLLIEANRTNTAIVGEDLGTVPDYVPRAMSRHGVRRMYVVQYEARPGGHQPAGVPPQMSMASVNTHDMPTFAGFWRGRDIADRVSQGLLDEHGAAAERAKRAKMREALIAFFKARGLLQPHAGNTLDGAAVTAVLQALLAWLAASDAEMVLVNLEDLWLEEEPQNRPGVPELSWRGTLRLTLEEARRDPTVMRMLRTVDDERRKGNGDTEEADDRSSDAAR